MFVSSSWVIGSKDLTVQEVTGDKAWNVIGFGVFCSCEFFHHQSTTDSYPRLFTPPYFHIWDLMLVWRKGNIEKLSPCYSIVYYYNGAQRYEQFLQVGQLYQSLNFDIY